MHDHDQRPLPPTKPRNKKTKDKESIYSHATSIYFYKKQQQLKLTYKIKNMQILNVVANMNDNVLSAGTGVLTICKFGVDRSELVDNFQDSVQEGNRANITYDRPL